MPTAPAGLNVPGGRSMRRRAITLTLTSALALLLLVALPATSQVAKIENAGNALVFYPTQEAEWYALTITGPCNYEYRVRAEPGEIVFKLPKDAMDGSYVFSLDTRPRIDPEVMEILHKARVTGDNQVVRRLCREGRLPDNPVNQTGAFTVIEGKIILDTTPESERQEQDEGRQASVSSLEPGIAADADLAAGYRAATPEFLLASADAPAPTGRTGECVWARMKPGAGLDGR